MKPINTVLRVGLWFLALAEGVVGVVATLIPRFFYDRVPWVSLASPYSEHLMRDVGALSLALALVLMVAAITMERLLIRTALPSYVVFALPHLLFHVTHHQHYTTTAATGETMALVIAVLIPIALLVLQSRDVGSAHRLPTARW